MKLTYKLITSSILTLIITSHSALAVEGARGEVIFKGNVQEGACNIDNDNLHQTVNFGDVGKSVLANGGNQTIPFNIKLTGCDPEAKIDGLDKISTVGVKFDGGNGEELFNPNIDGFAKGVSVKVYSDQLNKNIKFDGTTPVPQNIVNGDMNYSFRAILAKSTSNPTDVTTGKIETKAMFVVEYL